MPANLGVGDRRTVIQYPPFPVVAAGLRTWRTRHVLFVPGVAMYSAGHASHTSGASADAGEPSRTATTPRIPRGDRSDRHDPARHDTNGENPPFASQSRIWSSLLLDIGTNGQLDKVLLICRAVCQVGRVDRVRWAGGLGWSGGRDAGLGVGVASLMMRGLGTPGPGFVLPACAV
jgi:hypothetical protein